MLNIVTIGIGSCGNQMVKLTILENFRGLAINSTTYDTDSLENICDCLIVGGQGCGKDRKLGKKLFKDRYQNLLEKLDEVIIKADVVVIEYGLGGGTGCGMGPILTNILRTKYSDVEKYGYKLFINGFVYPQSFESALSQYNVVEAMTEIETLEIPYIAYDNDKAKFKNITEVYSAINMKFVGDLKIFRGDYALPSEYSIMDDKDRLSLLSTKGMMVISEVKNIKETELNDKSLSTMMLESLKNNYCVNFERDKVVKKMGFVLNLTNDMISQLDRSYAEIKEFVGEPSIVFEQINVLEDGKEGSIHVILAGLSHPKTRIQKIEEELNAKKSKIKTSNVELSDIKNKLNWLVEEDSTANKKKTSIEDALNMF